MATMKDVRSINIGITDTDYEVRVIFLDGTFRSFVVPDWKFDSDLYKLSIAIFDAIEQKEVKK